MVALALLLDTLLYFRFAGEDIRKSSLLSLDCFNFGGLFDEGVPFDGVDAGDKAEEGIGDEDDEAGVEEEEAASAFFESGVVTRGLKTLPSGDMLTKFLAIAFFEAALSNSENSIEGSTYK